jgi:hypothetical protein
MAGAAIATEGTRPGTKEDFERLLSTGVKMQKVR